MDDATFDLWALFRGSDRAHGRYRPSARALRAGEKVEGSAVTVRAPATAELWAAHLAGDYGLGVVPIRDDGGAAWGAIDVDVYDGLDHAAIVAEVRALGLPLVVARTKSGGAHLFLFTAGEASATLVRGKLVEWAVALGYPGVEIFPKQVRLSESENDLGNWLNVPYYAGDRTTRYAVDDDGAALDVVGFIEYAHARRVDAVTLAALVPAVDETIAELFEDGPPCLQTLAMRGFPAGTRNNALFNVAVYLRARYPDDWGERLDAYNERFMDPPLGHKEVVAVRRSVGRKDYGYRCKDQPIASVCSREICLARRFGIGGDADDPGVLFGDLTQVLTDPVSYLWDVNGVRLEFPDARTILDQRAFRQVAMDRIKKIPNLVSERAWAKIVREKLERAETVTPPEDVSTTGQLWEHLIAFLTQRAQARELDELLLGRPYVTEEHAFFRVRDFLDHLRRYRVAGLTEKQLYQVLRDRGAVPRSAELKGRTTRYWEVPAPERQTAEFTVPRAPVLDE